jgi:hypothetical protein
MYGLPQAGILANKLLKKHPAKHDYFEQPHTPGLWKHESRPVWFNLAVDDFGIKYIGEEHLRHLYNASGKRHTKLFKTALVIYTVRGINLRWNYNKGYIDLSMPNYVMKQLTRYANPAPDKPQHCPYSPNPINYEKDNQAPTLTNKSHLLGDAGKKPIQQVTRRQSHYIDGSI